MKGVYLLHFSGPLSHANHYIGYSDFIDRRIEHHKNRTGAKITRAAVEHGIELIKARVWEGADRTFERKLHKYKKSSLLCPVCSGNKAKARMK